MPGPLPKTGWFVLFLIKPSAKNAKRLSRKTRNDIIDDIVQRDEDPLFDKRDYPGWLKSLTDAELKEYYELIKLENPPIRSEDLHIVTG